MKPRKTKQMAQPDSASTIKAARVIVTHSELVNLLRLPPEATIMDVWEIVDKKVEILLMNIGEDWPGDLPADQIPVTPLEKLQVAT